MTGVLDEGDLRLDQPAQLRRLFLCTLYFKNPGLEGS